MPVPHFNIKITQRSKGKSAVAGAAYQAGEKLFSEYDQKTKNYTCKKEVVYTEIMLPPNAPPEYADRAALWNSVEEIEKQWNSQLARRFVAALPREVPMELLPQMVKEYCEDHFVSKGIVGVFVLLILMVMSGFSSCGILFSGSTQVSGQTIYSAEDRDIRGAEQDYKKLEKELDKKIKRTPQDHPGYNEYQYHLDPIEHDPWQLTSFLTTLCDDYTRSEVQGKLQEIFKKQYKLTTWVEVQIRYKTVWVISPAGIPVPTQVPYEYKIFHTKLENRGLEVVIREELTEDQWKRYEIFQDTLGGRPYLFNGGLPPGGSDGSGAPGIVYTVSAEALTDTEFAAIYEEAKKYVGTSYVWGGSTPETGFDCSGYVCWVYNQNGYDVGRTTANGLWQKSQHISEAEAKPGDLVFFKGTYDTPGMSHVGIYLGNGKMVSAGDPIKYADIHSSYWQQYLAGFGRLSK